MGARRIHRDRSDRTLVFNGRGLVSRIPGLHQSWQTHMNWIRGVLLEHGSVLLNGIELAAEVEGTDVHAEAAVRPPSPPRRQRKLTVPERSRA